MNKDLFLKIFIIVVFASGLAIYFWNLAHGRNLTQPVPIDFSQFDLPISAPPTVKDESVVVQSIKVEATKSSGEISEDLAMGYIYFSTKFLGLTAEETKNKIQLFLKDFPSISAEPIEDLRAKKDFEIKIADPIVRAFVLKILRADSRWSVVEKQAPFWLVSFQKPVYFYEAKKALNEISSYLEVVEQKEVGVYLARIKSALLNETDRQILQKSFSDVVLLK